MLLTTSTRCIVSALASIGSSSLARREPISVPETRLSAQLAKPRSRSTKASYADPTTLPANFACNVTGVIPAASSRAVSLRLIRR
jgi:hypothetical protein